jgi:sRNA-binding carbon storage regulator CsrA
MRLSTCSRGSGTAEYRPVLVLTKPSGISIHAPHEVAMQFSLSINDRLTIGSVQIDVLQVWHDRVKLGINDPSASPVYREEILSVRSDNDDDDEPEVMFESYEFEETNPLAIQVG